MLPGVTAATVIVDKATLREARVSAPLREASQMAVIPPKHNRKEQREYDCDLYEARPDRGLLLHLETMSRHCHALR